jgi:hypothetical protein
MVCAAGRLFKPAVGPWARAPSEPPNDRMTKVKIRFPKAGWIFKACDFLALRRKQGEAEYQSS